MRSRSGPAVRGKARTVRVVSSVPKENGTAYSPAGVSAGTVISTGTSVREPRGTVVCFGTRTLMPLGAFAVSAPRTSAGRRAESRASTRSGLPPISASVSPRARSSRAAGSSPNHGTRERTRGAVPADGAAPASGGMIRGGAPVSAGVAVGQLIRTASARTPWPGDWVQPRADRPPRLRQPSPGTWAWTVAPDTVDSSPGTVIAVTASSGRARSKLRV